MVRRIFEIPSRRRRFEVESPVNYRAAEHFLRRGARATFEFLDDALGADQAVANKILRRLRKTRRFPNPVAGGLAGVRAIVFDHGPDPEEVEFFAIENGAVVASERLGRPSRESVRGVVLRMVEARNGSSQMNTSSINFVVAWLHQHFGDRNVAIVRGSDDFDRMTARIWRHVRELTRD
jgi:hypothetical protein